MSFEQAIVYENLGFPVIITNPVFRMFESERILDVSQSEIMQSVFCAIPNKKWRFIGAEIRFIRAYMKLTQQAFADMIGETDHSSISKWESKRQEITGMDPQTEILIRMQCKFFTDRKARIGKSFLANMLGDALRTKELGKPMQIAI